MKSALDLLSSTDAEAIGILSLTLLVVLLYFLFLYVYKPRFDSKFRYSADGELTVYVNIDLFPVFFNVTGKPLHKIPDLISLDDSVYCIDSPHKSVRIIIP